MRVEGELGDALLALDRVDEVIATVWPTVLGTDGRLMSVQLRIGDAVLPEPGVLAPPSVGGTPVVLALEVDDADRVFAQAVAAGVRDVPHDELFSGAAG